MNKEKIKAKLIVLLKDCGDPYPIATASYLMSNGVTLLNPISLFAAQHITLTNYKMIDDKELLERHIKECLSRRLADALMEYAKIEKENRWMNTYEPEIVYKARIDVLDSREE